MHHAAALPPHAHLLLAVGAGAQHQAAQPLDAQPLAELVCPVLLRENKAW